jgi:hypothetical protein
MPRSWIIGDWACRPNIFGKMNLGLCNKPEGIKLTIKEKNWLVKPILIFPDLQKVAQLMNFLPQRT